MRSRVKNALGRLNLAQFAFRTRERLRSLRPRRPATCSDGFPLPPARLMVLVTGSADTAWYTQSGPLAVENICGVLRDANLALASFRSILDFGCGCGRVIRCWPPLTKAALHGSDYNPELVDWCRRNLLFAKFQRNTLAPRLDYADHQFEFAYALSVFTHTPENLQLPWIDELRRILRPGGYLLITTQGDEYFQKLEPAERDAYRQGRLVVRYGEAAGTNLCSVYHPESWVCEHLAQGFSVIQVRPRAASANGNQDMYLLRKTS
jgi:SAM-dependent methyltransferase